MDDKPESSKVSPLILRELIKRGYSLEGNTRIWNIADSKLWYLTPEQAEAYLEVGEKSEEYKKDMIDTEIEFLEEIMPKIKDKIEHTDEVIMVDVGCGDGKKAIVPIREMRKISKVVYCPIDISAYMVQKAMKNISERDGVKEVINFRWNVSDFENMDNVTSLLRGDGKELFILFLGGTLGNFDMHDVLHSIQTSMEFGDSLLIGVPISSLSPEEMEKAYSSKYADEFLGKVLEGLGFERDEIKFGVRFRHSRVEVFYTIKKDKVISSQDKKIPFYKGDQIIVSYSQKYDYDKLDNAIKLYFGNYKIFTNEKKTWALVFCKK